jgi:hypothetical protein
VYPSDLSRVGPPHGQIVRWDLRKRSFPPSIDISLTSLSTVNLFPLHRNHRLQVFKPRRGRPLPIFLHRHPPSTPSRSPLLCFNSLGCALAQIMSSGALPRSLNLHIRFGLELSGNCSMGLLLLLRPDPPHGSRIRMEVSVESRRKRRRTLLPRVVSHRTLPCCWSQVCPSHSYPLSWPHSFQGTGPWWS